MKTSRALKPLAIVLAVIVVIGMGFLVHHQRALHAPKGSNQSSVQQNITQENLNYDKNLSPDERAFLDVVADPDAHSPILHQPAVETGMAICQTLNQIRTTGDFSLAEEDEYNTNGQIRTNTTAVAAKYLCKQNTNVANRLMAEISAPNSFTIQKHASNGDEASNGIQVDTWHSLKGVTNCHVYVLSPQGKMLRQYGSSYYASAGVRVPLTRADLGNSIQATSGCQFLVPDHASY